MKGEEALARLLQAPCRPLERPMMEDGNMEERPFSQAHERRFDPRHRASLLGEERRARWNPPRLLALAGLRAGQTALDLGSGPGFWTLPMAEVIGPRGQVIALDVSAEMLQALAARNPPAWVRLLQSELPIISLAEATVDLVWAAFVFHEVAPPAGLAVEVCRVLRPGGRLAVLDWRPDAAVKGGPPRHHRLSPQEVEGSLHVAGFAGIRQAWQDEEAYLLCAELPVRVNPEYGPGPDQAGGNRQAAGSRRIGRR